MICMLLNTQHVFWIGRGNPKIHFRSHPLEKCVLNLLFTTWWHWVISLLWVLPPLGGPVETCWALWRPSERRSRPFDTQFPFFHYLVLSWMDQHCLMQKSQKRAHFGNESNLQGKQWMSLITTNIKHTMGYFCLTWEWTYAYCTSHH